MFKVLLPIEVPDENYCRVAHLLKEKYDIGEINTPWENEFMCNFYELGYCKIFDRYILNVEHTNDDKTLSFKRLPECKELKICS